MGVNTIQLWFQRLAIATVALWCPFYLLAMWRTARPAQHYSLAPWHQAPTNPTAWIASRYLPLRPLVHDHCAIGFVADTQNPDWHARKHYLAQSFLAPTLVIDSTEHEIVLAAFDEDAQLERFLADKRFAVLHRLGPGMALLRRTAL